MNLVKWPSDIFAKLQALTILQFSISLVSICLILISCRTICDQPPEIMNRQQLEALKLKPAKNSSYSKRAVVKKKSQLPVPSVFKKKVSISITEEVALKDAIIELAHQTGINLQLDSSIEKRILFSAREEPLIEVIKDICEMVNLKYTISGQSIRIQVDTPYTVN